MLIRIQELEILKLGTVLRCFFNALEASPLELLTAFHSMLTFSICDRRFNGEES